MTVVVIKEMELNREPIQPLRAAFDFIVIVLFYHFAQSSYLTIDLKFTTDFVFSFILFKWFHSLASPRAHSCSGLSESAEHVPPLEDCCYA